MNQRWKLGRPSHATVVAYLALFVALGGSAYAVGQLPKNSVGSKQLKKNAVTTAKIKNEAVTAAKVKKGTLTGAQINASTLGTVPTAQTAKTADAAQTTQIAQTAQIANTIAAPEPWHEVGAPGEPQFQNGWGNVGAPGTEKVAFFKDHEGIVHLKGAVAGGSGVVFQLPPGYRPASEMVLWFAVACNGCGTGISTIRALVYGPGSGVEPSYEGAVLVTAPTVWLEGITFRAES